MLKLLNVESVGNLPQSVWLNKILIGNLRVAVSSVIKKDLTYNKAVGVKLEAGDKKFHHALIIAKLQQMGIHIPKAADKA